MTWLGSGTLALSLVLTPARVLPLRLSHRQEDKSPTQAENSHSSYASYMGVCKWVFCAVILVSNTESTPILPALMCMRRLSKPGALSRRIDIKVTKPTLEVRCY